MGVEEGETTCVDVASGSFAVGGGGKERAL